MSAPYQVTAITKRDGLVILSSHPTKQERDAALAHEREQFASNGSEDVLEIIAFTVHTDAPRPQAEEADFADALMAQLKLV